MMNLLMLTLLTGVILLIAYRFYGSLLVRLVEIDDRNETPAQRYRDDVDYTPIDKYTLLPQHFSAIAAAGPIVGPILAGIMFGWLPALMWILIGSIFIGGVHDLYALVASIRHRASSIAQVVKEHMSGRAYILFLMFVWLSLIYIIVAFTDVTAGSFIGKSDPDSGVAFPAGAVATSSLLYLLLPMAMGVLLRYKILTVNQATLVFLPLIGVAIWCGQYIPLDLGAILSYTPFQTQRTWALLLLTYCLVASLLPLWLLLQPRGYLGGYFLYIALAGGIAGIVFGNTQIAYPMVIDNPTQPLFPVLFITIACGACSGFHSIIASGTTSKQLYRESDAKLVGYGAMLMEAMVALISLACVMKLTSDSPLLKKPQPDFLYALGIGDFMSVLGIPRQFGVMFGLMAFTTFVYDTLDVCTRLGRYILQELFGLQNTVGKVAATLLTAFAPVPFLLASQADAPPVWRTYWNVFGASNQLLAALTLVGITVWLWQIKRKAWVFAVVGLPALFMYSVSMYGLARMFMLSPEKWKALTDYIPYVAMLLFTLGILLLVEAVLALARSRPTSGEQRMSGSLAPATGS